MSISQKDYWDEESVSDGYIERQISGLKSLGVAEMFDTALRHIKSPPKKILELGGGSQFVSRYLCERFPNAEIICTDLSAVRIQEADRYHKTKPNNLTTLGGVDACQIPYSAEEFDLIVGDAMLHHIPFLKSALFEINRCLKPNGKAIFVREPVIGSLGVMVYRFLQSIGKDQTHVVLNYFEYKRMLSQWQYEFIVAGFKCNTVTQWKNQGLIWKIRSIFPHLTPTYVGFVLTKLRNASQLVES